MEFSKNNNNFIGCLIGLAVGDAIGTTVEFSARGTFAPLTDMVGGGPFNLQPGQWTDDTSMALCLAHSLLHCQGFDAADQMNRYVNWYQHGYMSSTGACFDIGHTTVTALNRYLMTSDPIAGDTNPRSAGNGGIMRLAPIPMYFAGDRHKVMQYSAESSKTTHGAAEAVECAMLFGLHLAQALNGHTKQDIMSANDFTPRSEKVKAIKQQAYKEKSIHEIKGTGYVIDSLEAALWCFHQSESYSEAVLMAANLGDDADTTAAITGQLAGAYYGFQHIPDKWVNQLSMKNEIIRLAEQLHQHGI